MSDELTGRCLCESVEYSVRGELGPVFNCHCSKCRRWHGAAFRTRASINRSQFTWCKGEEFVAKFASSANVTKSFCSICGSPFISEYKNRPNILGLPLGALEQDPKVRPGAHIFVDSKSPWYEIEGDLPQYNMWPGSEELVRETSD